MFIDQPAMLKRSQLLTTLQTMRAGQHLKYLFLICVSLVALMTHAPSNAAGSAERALMLGRDISTQRLDDHSGNLTPDDVLSGRRTVPKWESMDSALNAGYLQHVVWLTFTAPAAMHPSDPLWLVGQPTYLDSVTLYQRDATANAWTAQRSGDYVPTSEKMSIRQHLFRLEPGKATLIRIETTSAMQFQASVFSSTQALAAHLASNERVMGLYFGAMMTLLLVTWAAAVIFRTHDIYALALLGTVSLLHVFNVRGYTNLWAPESWTVWASHSVGIGAFVLAATIAWQIREQLTRNTRYWCADRILFGLVVVNLLGTLSVPLGFYASVAWVNLASLVVADVFAVVFCLVALQRRQRVAQSALLLAAYVVHLLGGIPTTAFMMGITRWNIDITNLWQFQALVFTGMIACAVFVGMVQRYRQAKISNDHAIERLAHSEQVLEERIEQRTRELSNAQHLLKQALDSERELRQEQQQFFHMISHEFRTPLAVVDSAAAEQQSFPSSDLQAQTDRAKQIRRACRRLTSLVDSCLISERLDSAGFRLYAAPTGVAALLEHAAQLVHWSPRHQLRLFTEAAPAEWICDQALVRIALSNLVDNAVKYAAAGEIFIAAHKNDAGMLEISVADEGSGMSLEVMSRIFQRFERGDRTDQSKGFGLGLWVSRRVARLHGGDITVQSQRDHGARFTLTLAPQRVSTPSGL
ncbi:ATP-binding protein [Acidovorax radicis]|uniref:sensor histidine kinase n=1 Tax=Acidovorax radicis TaxID=758826 RepID=UPI001CFBC698|nr:ATP-binding protein [Acidovorax radicis]UCV00368.1 ATP-binding protein [Acidovorax radicis]